MKRTALAAGILLAGCGGGSGGGSTGVVPPSASGTTPISSVQGSAASSPLAGQSVTIEGVVTGDFQDNDADDTNNLGGFYLQSLTPDADPATSDGVFVYDGGNPATDVDVGDRVEVTGTVSEHFGETQVAATEVRVTGSAAVQPVDVNMPAAGTMTNSDGDEIADLERFEGMLLRFPQELFVSNLRNLERYGEVGLAQGGRPEQFTNANPPDAADFTAHKRDVAMRSIILDDGRREMWPTTFRLLNAGPGAAYSIRAGDSISGLTGNLRYARGSGGNGDEGWRLMPDSDPVFAGTNPRPGAPSPGGSFRVASFNVLNFFAGIDGGSPTCGPRGDDNCRGADSAAELARQLEKIVVALEMLDADVVGLVELENDSGDSVATIVDALNTRLGATDYAYVDTGTIHDDAIKTGLIYRLTTTQAIGPHALLDSRIDARFNDRRNRPALAQTFEATANGARFTVAINHLKSKGSDCAAEGDPNLGDGQGNCNMTRTNAAAALADWMASDPTGSGDADFIIMGDLNAYLREDPIVALQAAGLTSLISSASSPYSFLFDGQIGALDHAVVSPSLAPQVVDTVEWHINADEPPLLDYNLDNGRNPNLFDASMPYRASDHDPVVVGLDLTN